MSPNYLQEIYFIPKTDIYWKPNSEFLSNIISIFYNDDSNKHSLYNNTYELMYFDCDFKEALNYESTNTQNSFSKIIKEADFSSKERNIFLASYLTFREKMLSFQKSENNISIDNYRDLEENIFKVYSEKMFLEISTGIIPHEMRDWGVDFVFFNCFSHVIGIDKNGLHNPKQIHLSEDINDLELFARSFSICISIYGQYKDKIAIEKDLTIIKLLKKIGEISKIEFIVKTSCYSNL